MIEVDIRAALGDFSLNAKFESDAGVTALFGASGAGKSSIINAIAGLLKPSEGRIAVGGTTLYDSSNGIDLPVHKRGVRVVFQESRLFPHLNVRQNLLYGHRLTGKNPTPSMNEVTDLLGIAHLLKRRPRTLSGGERQRVSIGRALLANPLALLLDEPLASLDRGRKQEILPYLETLVRETKIPVLYVSHAQEEIDRLAQVVVRIENGTVKSIERKPSGG